MTAKAQFKYHAASIFILMVIVIKLLNFTEYSVAANNIHTTELNGHVQYCHTPSPETGVRLIRDILARLRNAPTLAMATENMHIENYGKGLGSSANSTDYKLAIQPKENSMVISMEAGPRLRKKGNIESVNKNGIWEAAMPYSAPPTSGLWSASEQNAEVQNVNIRNPANLEGSPNTIREYKTAILPPNIVTGISLIHLGSAESKLYNLQKFIGYPVKSKVDEWTVWSFQKSKSREIVLQVFTRHGLVEDLRIFDPGLIPPNLGIKLGNDLEQVKEQFGEPSFILPEGQQEVGQNYIYPISQVGFLLSRTKRNDTPCVNSLLIFNVK